MSTLRDPRRPPLHPGFVLRHDVLPAVGLSESEFAAHLGMPLESVEALLYGRERLSPDVAARIGRVLHTGARPWLELQAQFDAREVDQRQPIDGVEPLLPVTQPDHSEWMLRTISEATGVVNSAQAPGPDASRRWPATGVCCASAAEVPADELRKDLDTQLTPYGIHANGDFVNALEEAISSCRAYRELADLSRPGDARRQLRAALDAAVLANDKLADVNPTGVFLIDESVEGGRPAVNTALGEVIEALTAALNLIAEYRGGRPRRDDLVILAADVAHAIREHFGAKPRIVRTDPEPGSCDAGAAYLSVLRIAVEAATGESREEVHEIGRRGLSVNRIEQNDGLVEYIPES